MRTAMILVQAGLLRASLALPFQQRTPGGGRLQGFSQQQTLCQKLSLKHFSPKYNFLSPAPLCVRLLCPTKSLSRRLTRNLSCTSQLLEQCRLQRGEIAIFYDGKRTQDSKKSEVIWYLSMQWRPRVMLSHFHWDDNKLIWTVDSRTRGKSILFPRLIVNRNYLKCRNAETTKQFNM